MGIDFARIGYLNHCASMEWGSVDLNMIEIKGENIKDHIKNTGSLIILKDRAHGRILKLK